MLVRLRAESEWTEHFSTNIEADYVALAWEDDFTNGVHFNAKPVIPDAEGFDLNQAVLRYAPTQQLHILIGREAIELGNQRFVGSNSFWQNEQTFDTAGVDYEFGSASKLSYRYVVNANRIQGDEADSRLSRSDSNFAINNGRRPAQFLGDHEHNSHLIFADFKEWDYSRFQAYYFDMDIDEAPGLSNETLGLRYEYKGRKNRLRLLGHLELAGQQRPEVDRGNWLPYANLGAGLGYRAYEWTASVEELGANKGIAFVTPLASLHDFNGWGDKFLLTPTQGLRDYSLKMLWRRSPWKVDLRYHFFHTANNNASLGEELNIDVIFKPFKDGMLFLRMADFQSRDSALGDEQRVFLQFVYNI